MPTGKTIAYQGIPGSFSHLAAFKHFGEGHIWHGTSRFAEIFKAVHDETADLGIIPLENSLAGSVYENYDLLSNNGLHIVAEEYLRVEHNLLGLPDDNALLSDRLRAITTVYSHPKALEQCTAFFEAHPWMQPAAHSDTARAALHVSESSSRSFAAIASCEAASIYGLAVLKRNIEDNPFNVTRFVVISKRQSIPTQANKCSIIFTAAHEPGSLFRTLAVLAEAKVNLTKLESRPIPEHPFEYNFYVDFCFTTGESDKIEKVLLKFKKNTIRLTTLGYYPAESVPGK
jgi:prephenate dehydratase